MFRRKVLLPFVFLIVPWGTVSPVPAADHLDAPDLRIQGQGGRDINDVYTFLSPNNPANTVLIVTVNPFAGMVNPFGTISERTFDPGVEYQLQIDNNGDAVADVTYATTFTPAVGGVQTLTTTRNGASVATGSTGADVSLTGGGTLHAALFDDPFFFDLVGFNNNFNFTGDNTFEGADVSAIVLEVPSTQLQDGANTNIGVWARTLVGGNQIDRMGRPAINTALIPSAMKDAFNAGSPETDVANFSDEATAAITSLSDADNAAALTPILLPDVLTFDTSDASGFLNGRRPEDDVIDAELDLLTEGALVSDGVDANDVPFLGVFPYLAAPNLIPEPSALALAAIGILALAYGGMRRRRRT
jgi:hypothetical protein